MHRWKKSLTLVGMALAWVTAMTPGYAAQEEIPLVVIDEDYDPHTGTLRFSLINQGDKLIVAWGFMVTTGDGAGNEQATGLAEDHVVSPHLLSSFDAPPGLEMSHPLKPGDMMAYTRPVSLDGDPAFHVVNIEVTSVIFDDASAMGDRTEIEHRYQYRLGELEATKIFLELIEMSVAEKWPGEDLLAAVLEAEAAARTEYDQIHYEEKAAGGKRVSRAHSKASQFKSLLYTARGMDLSTADGLQEVRKVALQYRTLLRKGLPEHLLPLE